MARILLADDDQGSRDLVRRALEMDGHTVIVAEDGSDADGRLKAEGPFHLLVTDVQMPGIDGIELGRRALAAAPHLRIVMMSGYADVLESARQLNAPGLRLLTKPFTIEKIRAEVRAALA